MLKPSGSGNSKKIDAAIFMLVGLSTVVVGIGLILIFFSDDISGLFGQGELERVDFETITLTPENNHYLACHEDFCKNARPDEITDVYAVPVNTLRDRLTSYIDRQPRIEIKEFDLRNLEFVLFEYFGNEPFPDVISIKLYDLGAPRSGISILSQTVTGSDDEFRNRQRVQKILEILKRP